MINVCFIGLGSIAERHIGNIRRIFEKDVNITVRRSGKGKSGSKVIGDIDRIIYDDVDLEPKYDAIFITNPTFLHYETLLRYQNFSDAFFIEKPVFVTGEEDLTPFGEKAKKYYVAAPIRYTNVVQYLRKNINFQEIYSVRCICSSYLPEWRPGMDYKLSYSAHKDMGGGVSIDLIHEWDYLYYLVGMPECIQSIIRKKSALEIDSDDVAVYIAEYKDKVVELHLDYFGRHPQRKIELIGRDDTIVADILNHSVEYLLSGEKVNLPEERNDFYIREIKHFWEIIKGDRISDNGLEGACKMLRIARGII